MNRTPCIRCDQSLDLLERCLHHCPPVVGITNKPDHGDAHWRLIRPATRLREARVDAQVCWLDDDDMPTVPVAGRVVVLQRVTVKGDGPEFARTWTDRLRAAGALAVVYELDDDELTGAEADHLAASMPMGDADRAALDATRQALLWTLAACDGATVSTEPLAEVVRQYTDRPVIVVPNALDTEWFRERLAPRAPWADHLTIGWAGWRRPDADLEPMAEAWARISRRYPDVHFVVAGHQPDVIYRQNIPLDRIIRLPIAPLDEYPRMYQVSIGCCAVADTPFSRCKSPIKAWEYAIAGAAVVATPTLYGPCLWPGVDLADWDLDPVLRPRFNLAQRADEWERSLSALIEYPDLRADERARLLAHVLAEHSLTANLHRWESSYKTIADSVSGKMKVRNASA